MTLPQLSNWSRPQAWGASSEAHRDRRTAGDSVLESTREPEQRRSGQPVSYLAKDVCAMVLCFGGLHGFADIDNEDIDPCAPRLRQALN